MTLLDDIAKYGIHPQCEYCFFGMIVAGKCTRCDGREEVAKAIQEEKVREATGGKQ